MYTKCISFHHITTITFELEQKCCFFIFVLDLIKGGKKFKICFYV